MGSAQSVSDKELFDIPVNVVRDDNNDGEDAHAEETNFDRGHVDDEQQEQLPTPEPILKKGTSGDDAAGDESNSSGVEFNSKVEEVYMTDDGKHHSVVRPSAVVRPTDAADGSSHSSGRVSASSKKAQSALQNRITSSISSVKDKTNHVASKTIHNTKHLWKDAEEIVDNNVWCLPLRCITHFRRDWPRTTAFIFGVVVPLWVLIFIAMGFGVLLAEYEKTDEIDGNNAILAARAKLALAQQRSLERTLQCAAQWGSSEEKIRQELNPNSTLSISNLTFPLILDNLTMSDSESLLYCISGGEGTLSSASAIEDLNGLAYESLSFNWNRCWNRTRYEKEFDIKSPGDAPFVFYPTEEQINGTRPDEQYRMFSHFWDKSQKEEFDILLGSTENATAEEIHDALLLSFDLATGEGTCRKNTAATAWFFFTIMTTIGT